jgi:AraC family cel operon transcriptional repressor
MDYFGEGFNAERLLNPEYPPTLKLTETDKNILIVRFESLNTIPREKKSRIKSEFRILIAEIFSRYFREVEQERNEDIPSWLLKLKDEMRKKENFTAGINRMYELSDRSPEHLSRTFKKYFNETPTDFLIHLRLNYAANLLANSDKTISEISLDAGFENLSHFYHLFKREFKVAPKDFRMKNQKIIIPY